MSRKQPSILEIPFSIYRNSDGVTFNVRVPVAYDSGSMIERTFVSSAKLLDQKFFLSIFIDARYGVPETASDSEWNSLIHNRLSNDSESDVPEKVEPGPVPIFHPKNKDIHNALDVLDDPYSYKMDEIRESAPKKESEKIRKYLEVLGDGDKPRNLIYDHSDGWMTEIPEHFENCYGSILITESNNWPIMEIHSSVVNLWNHLRPHGNSDVAGNEQRFRNSEWAHAVIMDLIGTRLRNYTNGAKGTDNWFGLTYQDGGFKGLDMFYGLIMGTGGIMLGQELESLQGEPPMLEKDYRIAFQKIGEPKTDEISGVWIIRSNDPESVEFNIRNLLSMQELIGDDDKLLRVMITHTSGSKDAVVTIDGDSLDRIRAESAYDRTSAMLLTASVEKSLQQCEAGEFHSFSISSDGRREITATGAR